MNINYLLKKVYFIGICLIYWFFYNNKKKKRWKYFASLARHCCRWEIGNVGYRGNSIYKR